MPTRNRLRAGNAADWTAANRVLKSGEIGVEVDTGRIKIGNGATSWNSLHYNVSNSPVISAVDRGVKGDGITDDTAALNALLAVGGTIVLRPGTYRITDTLVGTSNTTLIGYGLAKIVLDTTSNVDPLQFVDCSNINIFGLEIDGQKSTKTSAVNTGRGIHLWQVQRATVANCYVHDTYEHGIRVGGNDEVDTADTVDIIVRDNVFKDCGNAANDRGWGIWCFWRVKDSAIVGNLVSGCHAGGIMMDDASSDATPDKDCLRFVINNNTVRDSDVTSAYGRGICVEGARNFSVCGNVITGHNKGIVINDGQGGTDTGLGAVSGNSISARYYGMQITDCRDVTVAGNFIEVTSWSSVAHGGIKLEQGTAGAALARINVVGNTIKSNGAGISTRMTPGYVPSGAGVGDLTIADNTLTFTGTPGSNNQHVGIQMYDVDNPVIRNNTVTGFYDGIYNDGACTTPIVQNNIVENSYRYGCRVGTAGTIVTGNKFRGNGTSSLLFDASARVASTVVSDNISTDVELLSGTTDGPTYVWPTTQTVAGQLEVSCPQYTGGQVIRLKVTKATHGGYTVAPSTGTWEVGDKVWNDAPTSGAFVGWVCVAGGTPGTWLGFGLVE